MCESYRSSLGYIRYQSTAVVRARTAAVCSLNVRVENCTWYLVVCYSYWYQIIYTFAQDASMFPARPQTYSTFNSWRCVVYVLCTLCVVYITFCVVLHTYTFECTRRAPIRRLLLCYSGRRTNSVVLLCTGHVVLSMGGLWNRIQVHILPGIPT